MASRMACSGLTLAEPARIACLPGPANGLARACPGLAAEAEVAQREIDVEAVAALGIGEARVVAPPGEAELEAVVGIGESDPRPQRLETVCGEARILFPVGQVYHRRAECGPVLEEHHATRRAQLL